MGKKDLVYNKLFKEIISIYIIYKIKIELQNTETNQNITKLDIEKYQKLLLKEQKQKDAQKKFKEKETPEQKQKRLEYLKQYALQNRDTLKEKDYYEKNKERILERSTKNIKKYLLFYKMYKDKHPEFENEFEKTQKKTLETE